MTELAITPESADRGTYARLGNRANGRYVVKTYLDGWVTVGTAQPVDPDEFRAGWEVVSEAEARNGAPLTSTSTTRCANSACPSLPHEGRFVMVETPTPVGVGGPATSQMREYVVGFLICERSGLVALVRKARPDWQAGRLNGVGGKVEAGETPLAAMRREFAEEAGLDLGRESGCEWEHFLTIEEPGKRQTYGPGKIHFYRLFVPEKTFSQVRAMTDEPIETHPATAASLADDALPNLSWILPLALYRHDTYEPIVARETMPDGQDSPPDDTATEPAPARAAQGSSQR
jgi:8-oxo-dGTP diphosphatase